MIADDYNLPQHTYFICYLGTEPWHDLSCTLVICVYGIATLPLQQVATSMIVGVVAVRALSQAEQLLGMMSVLYQKSEWQRKLAFPACVQSNILQLLTYFIEMSWEVRFLAISISEFMWKTDMSAFARRYPKLRHELALAVMTVFLLIFFFTSKMD